jgi:hypothetical protein
MDTSNTQTGAVETPQTSLARDWLGLLQHWLRNRRVLIALAAAVVTILNWNWLVAIGVAPIILSLLPCAAMCAIGLCAMRGGNSACGEEANKNDADRSARPVATQANKRESGSE